MTNPRFILAASIAAALTTSAQAAPATKTDFGTNLADTTTVGVWTGGSGANGEPTFADTATFGGTYTTTAGIFTVDSPVTWNNMNFLNTLTGDVSISGSPITLIAPAASTLITHSSTKAVSIANDLIFTTGKGSTVNFVNDAGGRIQISAGGTGLLTLNNVIADGTTANDANLSLRGAGSGGGVINGTVTVDGQLRKEDGGVWALNGSNTIGWIFINNGTLRAGSDSAFGTGTIYISSGGGAITLASKDSTQRNSSNALDFTTNNFTNTANFGQTTVGTGALTFSGGVSLGGANRNIATNVSTTFSGNVTGTGGAITKTGNGTLTLSGTNSYTGGTTINAGHLLFSNPGALPTTGSISIGSAGALIASGVHSTVMEWLNSGRVNAASSGAIALAADSSDAIDFATGGFNSLALSSSVTSATHSGTITPGTSGYIFSGSTGTNLTVSSTLEGSSPLTKNGTGSLTLSGNNTFSGGMTFTSGILLLGHNNALGTGLVTQGSTAVVIAAADATPHTIANDFKIGNQVTFGQATGGTGALTFSGGMDLNGAVRTFTTAADTTLSGVISNGGITKNGPARLTLSNANTYSGQTTISAGTLAIGNNTALGTGTVRIEGGATIASADATTYTLANSIDFAGNFNFGTASTGNLKFAGPVALGNADKIATIHNAVTEFAGVVSSGATTTSKFGKAGTGTLLLSGNNTYVRQTEITDGVLVVNGTHTGGNSYTVLGGTLSGTGSIQLAGIANITVGSNGTIAPGNGGIGTLTIDSSVSTATNILSMTFDAKFLFELNTGLQSDKISLVSDSAGDFLFTANTINFADLSGGLLDAGQYLLFDTSVAGAFTGLATDFDGFITSGLTIGSGLSAYEGSNLQVVGDDIVLNVVPEPASFVTLLGGIGMVLSRRRRGSRA